MEQFTAIAALRRRLDDARRSGRRIGLVPTMGALHAGHAALIAEAIRHSDVVVVSVFVNPLQFGPGEDFERYPRDLAADAALAAAAGAAVLFAPEPATLTPLGATIRVVAGEPATRWEGAVRPGHFDGVLTIVAKLFNIVGPDLAVFGQKDIQQVTMIRRMLRDLDYPITLRVTPIVRAPDGLAMSSRNRYLDAAQRRRALLLPRALDAAASAWERGVVSAGELGAAAAEVLGADPSLAVDYIAVTDDDTMLPVETATPGTIISAAVRVGSTRLIDNVILAAPGGAAP